MKNRVHAGHMLSLDDGYRTAGCLRVKIFINQVKILPMNCLLKHLLLQLVLMMYKKYGKIEIGQFVKIPLANNLLYKVAKNLIEL